MANRLRAIPTKIPEKFLSRPRNECRQIAMLQDVLGIDEINFFHDFLADYDVFTTLLADHGQRGWHDICFGTADSLFHILTSADINNLPPSTILYDDPAADIYYSGKKRKQIPVTTQNWKKMLSEITNPNKVILFGTDGIAEGHGFIVYP